MGAVELGGSVVDLNMYRSADIMYKTVQANPIDPEFFEMAEVTLEELANVLLFMLSVAGVEGSALMHMINTYKLGRERANTIESEATVDDET